MTKTMMYLIEDLVKIHEAYHNGDEVVANQGQALDGFSALANYDDIARRLKHELENL